MSIPSRDRFRGCLLGLAAGDAVGTTVEFASRGSFAPVTDMTGGGPFRLDPGQWTDDTSMALCLATSLLECDGFDAGDQMERYCRWRESGYLSSTGRCFDIGTTVAGALRRFRETGEPFAGSTNPRAAFEAERVSDHRARLMPGDHERTVDQGRNAGASARRRSARSPRAEPPRSGPGRSGATWGPPRSPETDT